MEDRCRWCTGVRWSSVGRSVLGDAVPGSLSTIRKARLSAEWIVGQSVGLPLVGGLPGYLIVIPRAAILRRPKQESYHIPSASSAQLSQRQGPWRERPSQLDLSMAADQHGEPAWDRPGCTWAGRDVGQDSVQRPSSSEGTPTLPSSLVIFTSLSRIGQFSTVYGRCQSDQYGQIST